MGKRHWLGNGAVKVDTEAEYETDQGKEKNTVFGICSYGIGNGSIIHVCPRWTGSQF